MEPTLHAGEGLVGVRGGRVRVGELRVVEHPQRPGFWLVKRVEEDLGDGRIRVRSDNDGVTTTDSRSFGAVAARGSYRVLLAVTASPRGRPVPRRAR